MDNFEDDNNPYSDEDNDYYSDEDSNKYDDNDNNDNYDVNNQNNQINQINLINQNNIINQNNQNNQINNQNIFGGHNYNKNGCTECLYCGKFFGNEYIIDGTCAHCWGFCFCGNFDLEKFTYNGDQQFNVVKNYLSKTNNFHPKSCNSMDCIYYKINKFNMDKKLNRELGEYLGIMEPLVIKKEENKVVGTNISFNKKRNVKINFKLSSISI
jgi:hypothetical protein